MLDRQTIPNAKYRCHKRLRSVQQHHDSKYKSVLKISNRSYYLHLFFEMSIFIQILYFWRVGNRSSIYPLRQWSK